MAMKTKRRSEAAVRLEAMIEDDEMNGTTFSTFGEQKKNGEERKRWFVRVMIREVGDI